MPLVRLLAGFLLTTLLAAAPLAAPQPAIARDFADPDLLQVGSTYYAYSSNAGYDGRMLNIPVAHAAGPTGPWTVDAIDALPNLPGWVSFDSGSGNYQVWAPDVSRRADGVYLMFYTARHTSGLQCIGAARPSTCTTPPPPPPAPKPSCGPSTTARTRSGSPAASSGRLSQPLTASLPPAGLLRSRGL
jgi:beta-xylosidase